jgi:hypothetical protein
MEKVATHEKESPDKPDLSKFRTFKGVVKALQDPQKALGKALVSGVTMKALSEKEAGIKPLGIYGLLNEHYGRDWWHWEPETVWQTLRKEHGLEPSEDLRNLVSALQLIVTTNQPFENWHIFEKVGHALNMNPVNFGVVQPLEIEEAALTLRLLRDMRPKQEFDSEICAYLAASARSAGVVWLDPSIFTEGCQAFLDHMGNDLELKEAVAQKKDTGGIDYEIQIARLNEIERYLKERA